MPDPRGLAGLAMPVLKPAPGLPSTVPMRYLLGMVAWVEDEVVRNRLLLSAGVDPAWLARPRQRVDLKLFSRLYATVARLREDESANLSADPIPPGAVETLCRVALTGRHLGESTDLMARALNALSRGVQVRALNNAAGLQLVLLRRQPLASPAGHAGPAVDQEVVLVTTYALLCWLVGRRLPLLAVHFACAAPRHRLELRTLFSAPLRFGQASAGLLFPASVASLLPVRSPAEVNKLIRRAPASLIEAMLTPGRLGESVRQLLHEALPASVPLHQVAQRLAMSQRTLHRRLLAEGESFQRIKDQLRHDLAMDALARGQRPLKQIAAELGYADQAAFQRAFVGWTGRSPGSVRKAPVVVVDAPEA